MGEIVTCNLKHCRCKHNGEENEECLEFIFRRKEEEGEIKMSEWFKDFYKRHENEFKEEEQIYQAECTLENTKTIMEGGRVEEDCA